jgi:hypothetical protein
MSFVIGLLLLLSSFEQQSPVDLENVPLPVSKCLQVSGKNLEISRRINPFYLRGDFDGDGRSDFVVLVQGRSSRKEGFAFCFAGSAKAHVVGAGTAIALEGGITRDDLAAFDVWGVAPAWSKRPRRDAVYLEQAEAGSGMLIWNGRTIIWQQTSI